MALSAAERKRRQREREKREAEKKRHHGGDAAKDLYRTPFSDWSERTDALGDLIEYTAMAGFELPPFDDERDPEDFVIDRIAFGEGDLFGDAKGALGRAEVTIGLLMDAALHLAGAVNQYKRNELQSRLSELEQPDKMERPAAIREAVRLSKMLDQLDKNVRRDLPQWMITEV
jgi:outer membrane murein-binding lipoprotein Lpp